MSAPVEIVPVQTKSQWRDFHHLPFGIYRDDPNWVAPLLLERSFHFQAAHNPYFKHARAAFFLAYREGKPVGRITAQVDQLVQERYRDGTGHFGFIEAIDDPEVFQALLKTAEDWLRQQGMKRAVGPVSFSLWDQPGLLVKGFDTPPSVMMNHHRPYYEGRITAQGYQKAEDLIAYRYGPDAPTETLEKLLARAMRGGDVTLRNIRMDKAHFEAEVAMLLDIINDAWSDNWGYVPMTKAEIDDLAGILKALQSTPVGAALALSVIRSVREFNFSRGVVDSELSWILERNTRVRHVIEMVGGVPYKTYRVFEKPL